MNRPWLVTQNELHLAVPIILFFLAAEVCSNTHGSDLRNITCATSHGCGSLDDCALKRKKQFVACITINDENQGKLNLRKA